MLYKDMKQIPPLNASKAIHYETVFPQDILDGLSSIEHRSLISATICRSWPTSRDFLDWSFEQRELGSDSGLAACVMFAKRAVASTIDRLLYSCYLVGQGNRNYVQKIKILNDMGVEIPLVVKDFVIDVRNKHEHEYERPSKDSACHAYEIAKMFIFSLSVSEAVSPEHTTLIAGNGEDIKCFQGMHILGMDEGKLVFVGRPEKPFLFIDSSLETCSVKIIRPVDFEGISAEINSFSISERKVLIRSLVEKPELIPWLGESPMLTRTLIGNFDPQHVSQFLSKHALI